MKKVGQTKTHKHTTGSLAKAQANAQSFTICAFAKLPGRYTREKKQETTERHLDVAKTRSAERYNYSNDHSINYTKAARHARVSPQVNYLKCICPQWTKVKQNDFNRGFKTNGSKLPSDEKQS